MIQINLLPVRTRKRRETGKQFIALYLLSILLAGGVIGYLWVSKEGEINHLNRRLSQLQADVQKFARYESLLRELKSKKEVVDRKRSVVEDLQKDRDSIARLLAVISVEIPAEKMWFERLAQTANSVTLDGVALSNEAIVEFMRNLESSPYVEKGSINLTHSRQTMKSDMKLREFQITCRFYPFSEIQRLLKAKAS